MNQLTRMDSYGPVFDLESPDCHIDHFFGTDSPHHTFIISARGAWLNPWTN